MSGHTVIIVKEKAGWTVACLCGFRVDQLSTDEAALDVMAWHKGDPSHLGAVNR